MFEAIIGFVVGILSSVWFLVAVVVMMCLSEFEGSSNNRRSGWAEFWGFVVLGLTFLVFDFTWQQYAIVAAAWLPLGLAWAALKWKFRVDRVREEWTLRKAEHTKKPKPTDSLYAQQMLEQLEISRNKSLITHWVILWPVSLFTSLTIDLYDVVKFIVTVKCAKLFDRISADLKNEINEEMKDVFKDEHNR